MAADPAVSDVAIIAGRLTTVADRYSTVGDVMLPHAPIAVPPQPVPPRPVPTSEKYPSRLFLSAQYASQAADPIPTSVKRVEYVVLNLYCGRRRGRDIQAQLEWTHHSSDFDIIMLSIDIAMHADLGDMMYAKTLEL